MNKKGSHVGAMLSFVIFITFLIFLYSILQPALKTETEKADLVDFLRVKLIENFTSELIGLGIETSNSESAKSCVSIPYSGMQSYIPDTTHLVIKNLNDNDLIYKTQGDRLSVKTGINFDKFLKIYHSTYIDSTMCTGGCVSGCYLSSYHIDVVSQMNEIFYKKTLIFRDLYQADYEAIKNSLNIPPNTEFTFVFKTAEGDLIKPEKEPPSGINIYVQEFPILYIDEHANLESGFLTVTVW